ncbi:MAG TPA: DUF4395 domain-containing protein [Chloroflexota bacterium]|jgi:hypothetical protein|nr:DUF4395 domain-containing protein [Chloroflexota bacterium]
MSLNQLFRFPNPVNEVAVRTTAGIMGILCAFAIAAGSVWLMAAIASSFVLRVAAGARLDPVALMVTRVIVPRLGFVARPTPGPPKRFAQFVGACLTGAALVLGLAGASVAAAAVLSVVVVFAALESLAGFCAGCTGFILLMRAGLIPEAVCEECANLALRWERSPS